MHTLTAREWFDPLARTVVEHQYSAGRPVLSADQVSKLMEDAVLRRIIKHFDRFTRNCLSDLPSWVNHLFSLSEQRQVTAHSHRVNVDGTL